MRRPSGLDHVHFGLDLSWDTFICLGTFLFGLAMLRRPGFGPVVGSAGMAIAVALYGVNFATFPEPPNESAIDLGPLIGLWYAVVSVLAPSNRSSRAHACQVPGGLSFERDAPETSDRMTGGRRFRSAGPVFPRLSN